MSGFGGGALAQTQTAVCSSTPGAGERVDCQEHDNDNPIHLDLDGVTITTSGSDKAVNVWKGGSVSTGGISIRFANGSITTDRGVGIDALHDGTGGIRIEVLKSIFNTGSGGGIFGQGLGDVGITVRDSSITTDGAGVTAHINRNGDGDIDIDLRNTDIESVFQGIQALHGETGQSSEGDINIRIEGGSITTTDGGSGFGVDASHHGTGDIVIWLSGTSITAPGSESPGIRALHDGSGDIEGFNGIRIDVLKSIFNTDGTGIHAEGNNPSSGSTHIVDANVAVHVRDSEITVTGDESKGVFGLVQGAGVLDIDLRNTDIETSGEFGHGVEGSFLHTGDGKLGIRIQGGSVTVTSDGAQGVVAGHGGTGDVEIHIRGADVSTEGNWGEDRFSNFIFPTAINSWVADGNIRIRVVGGSTVSTEGGPWAHGILAQRPENAGGSEIYILLQGSAVTTEGNGGYGITAWDQGPSSEDENRHIRIDVLGSTITTTGDGARGIYAWRDRDTGDIVIDVAGSTVSTSGGTFSNRAPYGIYGQHQGTAGDIFITVRDGSTVRSGSVGVYGDHDGAGNIFITVRDGSTVTTTGEASDGTPMLFSHGIWVDRARDAGDGDGDEVIFIRVQGSTVSTTGDGGYGITARERSQPSSGENRHVLIDVLGSRITTTGDGARGIDTRRLNGAGDIVIDVAGSTVSTSGGTYTDDFGDVVPYGIYANHQGSAGNISITVRDGSTVTTKGDGAHGVYARAKGGSIVVNIRNAIVRATGAGSHGVLVEGGGLDGDGNRMQTVTVGSEVMGGSGGVGIWLVGGGRVVIGPDGRVGANSGPAIRVTRTDPSDTNEIPRLLLELRLDPRSLDPEKHLAGDIQNPHGTTDYEVKVNGMTLFDSVGGATGLWTPIGAHDVRATGDDFASLAFARRFAPRAAVYEALPGVLLRIDDAGGPGAALGGGETLLRSAGTPIYARIAAGRGSYEPGTATVAARYDYDRFSVESGMDFPLDYELTGLTGLTGWAGVRVVSGSAKISSPAGGGRIEARGMGLIVGVAWEGEDDWYGRGRLSLTRYNADLSSETRGGLKSGATALVHGLDLEGGRRFDLDLLGRKTRLTARGALRNSGISLGKFEDGLFSRVSVTDADRLAAGAGVDMETGLLPRDGADRLTLRASLDAEQALSGGTKVDVSETALESEAGGTRLGAGLGAAYRFAGYTIGGSVGAGGLGSGDTSWSARLQARFAF